MYKAYVFRMYPDEKQKILIENHLEYLDGYIIIFQKKKQIEYRETGKSKSAYDEC